MAPPRILNLEGTPREIGLEHGRQLAEEIKRQIKIYEQMFKVKTGLSWAELQEVSKAYGATIQRLAPDLYVEIAAIAEGAGLHVLDIVILNCRSEIALGMFSDGCTSMGWNRGDKGIILAQNWDWTPIIKENCVLMSIKKQGKPDIYMATEAGLIGKIGFNSASVGVCFNAIRAKPTDSSKLPIHVALRVLLESTSKSEGIAKLDSLGSTASAVHILVADPTGPTSLELSPVGDCTIQPDEDGLIFHSNHFIVNRFVDEPPWLKGSPVRLDRIGKLTRELAEGGRDVSADVLRKSVFSDTFNAPESICYQEDPANSLVMRTATLVNFVMDLSAGRGPSAEVVWGQPGSGTEGSPIQVPW